MGSACYSYVDKPDGFWENGSEMQTECWEWVTIPHDYVVDQDLNENENNALGYVHYDNAWYRKHFNLEEDDREKRILLRFDGIAGQSTVYLNGCLMYHNFSAYNTFQIDITDYVYFDKENIIAVYVNTEEFEGWWYQGGGIYRDVHLTVTEPVAIDLYGVYAPYKKLNDTEWQIDFETTVINTDYDNFDVTAESRLVDKNENVVPNADEFVSFSVNSPAQILGTGSDNCYHIRISAKERKMYMGKISVAVKPAAGQKEIVLMAKSSNCSALYVN